MLVRVVLMLMVALIACAKSQPAAPDIQSTPPSREVIAQPAPEVQAEPEKPLAHEEPAPAPVDKDRLGRTYQEIYCAQKKGEMDKILGIYKANGFDTPQEFTKAWIEAAKDTDWVTKVAWDVSKKCK